MFRTLIFFELIASLGAREPIECTAVTDNVVLPTYHVMNNITRVNGVLRREPLNDANASAYVGFSVNPFALNVISKCKCIKG